MNLDSVRRRVLRVPWIASIALSSLPLDARAHETAQHARQLVDHAMRFEPLEADEQAARSCLEQERSCLRTTPGLMLSIAQARASGDDVKGLSIAMGIARMVESEEAWRSAALRVRCRSAVLLHRGPDALAACALVVASDSDPRVRDVARVAMALSLLDASSEPNAAYIAMGLLPEPSAGLPSCAVAELRMIALGPAGLAEVGAGVDPCKAPVPLAGPQ